MLWDFRSNERRYGTIGETAPAMLSLLGKRLLQLIPTLFFVSVIIFSLQQLLPGDPALIMAGEERDPAVIEENSAAVSPRSAVPRAIRLLGAGCALRQILGINVDLRAGPRSDPAKAAGDDPARLDGHRDCTVIGISAGIISAIKKIPSGTMRPMRLHFGASRRRTSGSGSC